MNSRPQQKNLVRDQFTATAQIFGDYALASRVPEAERLARMVGVRAQDRGVDLACGSGALALRFARQVRWLCALDLTPAILNRARHSAATDQLLNLGFVVGDAEALPFADRSLDFAVTSYSLHHMPDPARVIGEMARVVLCGGRVGVLDIVVPDDPDAAALNNHIERIRDQSHTRTLARGEFDALFVKHGLRILDTCVDHQLRSFNEWMQVAGSVAGDSRYQEVRHLLEKSIPDDAAGFHPRQMPRAHGSESELAIENTTLLIAGEKIGP